MGRGLTSQVYMQNNDIYSRSHSTKNKLGSVSRSKMKSNLSSPRGGGGNQIGSVLL